MTHPRRFFIRYEERHGGVLPLVIWVVPTEARREQLLRHLTAEARINPRLYRVLLLADIPEIIGDDDEVGRLADTGGDS